MEAKILVAKAQMTFQGSMVVVNWIDLFRKDYLFIYFSKENIYDMYDFILHFIMLLLTYLDSNHIMCQSVILYIEITLK